LGKKLSPQKRVSQVGKTVQQEVPLESLQDEYKVLAEKEASQSIHFTAKHRARMQELSEKITAEFDKRGGSNTVSFMGANPDIMRSVGEDAVKAARLVSRATADIIQATKTPPGILRGVKQAKEAMVDHDRLIRDAEFTHKLLEKTVRDVVPDTERQMLMVHAYENKMRGSHWKKLNEIEKGVVRWAAQEKAKLNRFIVENGVLEQMSEKEFNHIFHSWIDPKTGSPYATMYGKFSKGLPQAKQRKIPTYEAGMAAGLKPATTNMGKMIGLEWEAAMRAQQSRTMFKTLNSIATESGDKIVLRKGKPAQGIRFVERWDKLKNQGLTEDYQYYSHPSLDKAMVFKDAKGMMVRLKGPVGVHKDLFPFVKAYIESPTYTKLDNALFAAKSLKLSASFFHATSLAMQELANFRIPFKNIPRGLSIRKGLGPELRLLHREGLDLWKGYEDVGYKTSGFSGGKVARSANRVLNGMRSWLFDYIQPGMKVSFAHDTFNKILPRYLKKYNPEVSLAVARQEIEAGKISTDAINRAARDAVKAADGHFSHEHWKRSLLETNQFMVKLYFSPESRRWWQRTLLSPTWQREHLIVAKNVAKSFMPDKMIKKLGLEEIGPIKAEYRKYMLGALMTIGSVDLANLITTKRMDGKAKHIWENPEGKGFAIRAPWDAPSYTVTDKNGKERRVEGGPVYIRPLKSLFEVAEGATDPIRKVGYKLSPPLTAIALQFFPSRYRRKYEGVPDYPRRAKDFVLDAALPITVNQAMDAMKGKKGWKSAILPALGFPTSKVKEGEFLDYLLEDGDEAIERYLERIPAEDKGSVEKKAARKLRARDREE
jgi:hypothetical protein